MAGSVNKDADWPVRLYLDGLSIPQVSAETGIALSTLRFHLKRWGF